MRQEKQKPASALPGSENVKEESRICVSLSTLVTLRGSQWLDQSGWPCQDPRGVYEGEGDLESCPGPGSGRALGRWTAWPRPGYHADVFVRPASIELQLLRNKSSQIPGRILEIYFQNYTEHSSPNQWAIRRLVPTLVTSGVRAAPLR